MENPANSNPPEATGVPPSAPGSVTFDYKRFERLAERTVQDAIDNASMSPPDGYHELEGSAVAVADDCFLAGVQAMKTAMLNAIFDELNGNGPIDPPNKTVSQRGQ